MEKVTNMRTEYTQQMVDHFIRRTRIHISRVQKYANEIENKFPIIMRGLVKQAESHDASKFKDPEFPWYVYNAWKHEQENNGKEFSYSNDIADKIANATLHHITNNKHHPQYWDLNKDKLTIKNKDEFQIDATRMDIISLGEMVADFIAMGEELNTNPIDWTKNNLDKKAKFTSNQKDLVMTILNKVYSR